MGFTMEVCFIIAKDAIKIARLAQKMVNALRVRKIASQTDFLWIINFNVIANQDIMMIRQATLIVRNVLQIAKPVTKMVYALLVKLILLQTELIRLCKGNVIVLMDISMTISQVIAKNVIIVVELVQDQIQINALHVILIMGERFNQIQVLAIAFQITKKLGYLYAKFNLNAISLVKLVLVQIKMNGNFSHNLK